MNLDAGSVTPELVAKLREDLPTYAFLEYDKKIRLSDHVAEPARVVVAGGDGAVSRVARQLLHTRNTLGIVPAGTYNNFAHGVGIPAGISQAIRLLKTGRPRPVSVGRANGEAFLEAAMVGRFGQMLQVGKAIEDRDLGDLLETVGATIRSPEFEFTLSGDLNGHGTARSLFFANTPRIGAHIDIADGTPRDACIEARLGDAVLQIQRVQLRTRPRVQLFADSRSIGRTPVLIEVDGGALQVVLGPARMPRFPGKPAS
ncbi:MAG TPA: diacylglycerol kinase family protein [Candidatus Dormibacteraeota bacterium]